ncbi:MAG: folate family ECF transporter S component [Clostridia bacterium]|nr:folate family ECF transporter S component [Clostridia bacterium]
MVKNKNLMKLILTALFTGIAVVLKCFLGIPVNLFGGFIKDINLSTSIIMYTSIIFGPLYGGIAGGLVDLLAYVIRPMGAFQPLFTVVNILFGVIPSLFTKLLQNRPFVATLVKVAVTQTICSFILNTLILILLGYMPASVAWVRALSAFVLIPVHSVVIYYLLKATEPHYKKIFLQ